jgi:SAM-dependent methyltransferase
VTVPDLHHATRGFAGADVYERGRPGYPDAAVARIVSSLDLRAGRTVLDLAAGTGKLTRLLTPSGANVIAVEPVLEMRRELEQRVPGIVVLAGTAERMPLTDRYVDAVTVGQAFHWFRQDEALREIHRVLRPGGGVALVWNARDERHPVQAALSEVIDPLEGDTPRRKHREWRSLLADSGLFERSDRALFEHEQVVDEQGLVERVISISFIATAPRPVRDDVAERVRAIARRSEQPIRLPYMTEVYFGYATD